jgi:hypothetical protein
MFERVHREIKYMYKDTHAFNNSAGNVNHVHNADTLIYIWLRVKFFFLVPFSQV